MFNLRQTACATALIAAPAMMAAGAASAGGLAEPVLTPAPVPVAIAAPVVVGSDWSGFYGGAQIGYGKLESDALGEDTNGALYGVHAGYLYDLGSIVLGAELDYDISNISDATSGIDLDSVARLKVRAGYDAGNFMPYVTAGAARATTSGALAAEGDGAFAGLGVDYKYTDSIRVGAEVLQHKFEDFGGSGADIDATTIAARVSFAF